MCYNCTLWDSGVPTFILIIFKLWNLLQYAKLRYNGSYIPHQTLFEGQSIDKKANCK